jgi:hypothetical protein
LIESNARLAPDVACETIVRTLTSAWTAAAALLAAMFLAAFYDRYWRVRHCFNELGRCYDDEAGEVLLEQAGVAWGSLAAFFAVVALFGMWRLLSVRSQ